MRLAGNSFPKHRMGEKLIREHNGKCILSTHKIVSFFHLYLHSKELNGSTIDGFIY